MAPKLKKRFIIATILAAITLLFVLNINKIKFSINMLSLYNQEKKNETVMNNPEKTKPNVVDNPLQDIIDQENTVEKPVDTPITTEEPPTSVKPNLNPIVEKPSTPVESPLQDVKKPYMTIISEYNVKLEAIRGKFEGELDKLVTQGIVDYESGRTTNSQLINQYISSESNLEKVSDDMFDTIKHYCQNIQYINKLSTRHRRLCCFRCQ